MNTDYDQIIEAARRELKNELIRAHVDKEKARLRLKQNRTFWDRLFPFEITIKRKHA